VRLTLTPECERPGLYILSLFVRGTGAERRGVLKIQNPPPLPPAPLPRHEMSGGRSAAKTRTPLKMVKQATKRRRTQAGKEERYMQKVDRAVSRYGASAVSKYFQPGVDRTGGYYGRFAGRGAELKFFDTATSFSIDTSPEVPATGQLVLIPQGVTESTRVGRKCVIRSIQDDGICGLTRVRVRTQIRPMRSIWSWTSSAMALLPRTRTCSCRAWPLSSSTTSRTVVALLC